MIQNSVFLTEKGATGLRAFHSGEHHAYTPGPAGPDVRSRRAACAGRRSRCRLMQYGEQLTNRSFAYLGP